nr:hypothetical protein [Aquicoccus sp. G2-2]MEA1114505.1 hypothetical protein [Aquicoccus sp. G2-2]
MGFGHFSAHRFDATLNLQQPPRYIGKQRLPGGIEPKAARVSFKNGIAQFCFQFPDGARDTWLHGAKRLCRMSDRAVMRDGEKAAQVPHTDTVLCHEASGKGSVGCQCRACHEAGCVHRRMRKKLYVEKFYA